MEAPQAALLVAAAFFAAVFLVASGNTTNRAPLFWAVGYASLACALYSSPLRTLISPTWWGFVVGLTQSIYLVCIAMGAREFARSRERIRTDVLWVAGAFAAYMLSSAWTRSQEIGRYASGLFLSLGNLGAGWIVWGPGTYRHTVAAVFIGQGVLGLVIVSTMGQSPHMANMLFVVGHLMPIGLSIMMLRSRGLGVHKAPQGDPLTGTPLRQTALARLDAMLLSSRQNGTIVCVLGVNIEGFRRFNAAYGIRACDEILKEVARTLTQSSRDGDLVSRLNADEFVVAMPCGPLEQASLRAQWLASRLSESLNKPYAIGDGAKKVPMRFRIGVDLSSTEGDAAKMIENVSIAGESLRGRPSNAPGWAFFNQTMHETATRAALIERHLRPALESGELRLAYQPIVDFASSKIVKVEALLRWNSPIFGEVGPGEIIGLAERTGLITDIGAWALREACRQAAIWEKSRPEPIVVSVNVSARQLGDEAFADLVMAEIIRVDLKPELLDIELTESILVANDVVVSRNIERMRALGVRVSLDDFGTGYASLAYLLKFQIDAIKIDRSFVIQVTQDPTSRKLVEAICGIGRGMQLKIVAEGVETADQALVLANLGVHMMQGYLYGKPASQVPLSIDMPAIGAANEGRVGRMLAVVGKGS